MHHDTTPKKMLRKKRHICVTGNKGVSKNEVNNSLEPDYFL